MFEVDCSKFGVILGFYEEMLKTGTRFEINENALLDALMVSVNKFLCLTQNNVPKMLHIFL